MNKKVRAELAPTGVLRAGLNMANFLLVNGTTGNDEPDGVSPDMARAIAAELGIECQLVPYKGPGEVADDVQNNAWDIGNIAAEPERARTVQFSPAYCEIQATYLLPANSSITSIDQVDAEGVRIAVKNRAAYDLWLTENLKHASLVRTDTIDESYDVFVRDKLEVLAGLRPKLSENQQQLPGSRLFDESFTAVQQSIGCPHGRPLAAAFLREFVEASIQSGLVAELINKHGVTGRLSVAPLQANR